MFLFFDFGKKEEVSIFILDKQKIVFKETFISCKSDGQIISKILRILKEQSFLDKLKCVVVIQGFYSFTINRIAVITVNTMNFILNIPIINLVYNKDFDNKKVLFDLVEDLYLKKHFSQDFVDVFYFKDVV